MGRSRLAESLAALRDAMAHPPLRRAEVAFGLAWMGESAFTVALGVVAFRDGGAAAVGLVALLRTLPSAIVSSSLASVADRVSRERVLAGVSAVQAVAYAASALLLALEAGLAGVYALAVVATIAGTLFRPTHSALLPSLCESVPQLTSATVARGALDALGVLLGPALAGALLAVGDPTAIFAAAAVTADVAGGVVLGISYERPAEARRVRRRLWRDAVEGVRAVAGERHLCLVFGLVFAQTFVRGALSVLIVVMALDLLDLGEPGVGTLTASVGAGGLVGSLGVSLLTGSRHLGGWLAVALVLWGAPIALVGAVPTAVAAFALLPVVGLGNAVIDVPFFTLPPRLAADAVLARVFGIFEALVVLGVGLGSVAAPALIGLLGVRGALVATGLILPALALVTWRPLVGLDRRLVVRDEEIAVLRGTPMLGRLPVPAIEHLANRLRRRTLARGAVVFVQGDPGDAFFVIAEGRAEVIGDGVVVRTLGPGDGFGEIALLHDVPRTATVRAQTDLAVFELGRDDFLDAVTGYRVSSDAASTVVAGHLVNFRPRGVAI